jgi:putative transposase
MKRSAAVFEKTFYRMLSKLQETKKNAADKRFKFKNPLFAIDSSTVSLCLQIFKWASFRTTKAGIKIHTVYDIKKQIPDFLVITDASQSDHRAVSHMPIRKGAIYVLDRGYLCFKTLANIGKNRAFFVTRIKINTQYKITEKRKVTGKGILKDCLISFTGVKSADYPDVVRLVWFKNSEDNKVYEFLTNNFTLSSETIADIYKSRWDIELFFKWIKQNLKIKTFIGKSENAVLIQIWTAAIAYLLTEYLRFLSKTVFSLTETFRIISSNILASRDLSELLSGKFQRFRQKVRPLDVQLDFGF